MNARLEIVAKPGARVPSIERRGDAVYVAVRARAIDGAANEAILQAIAAWLHVAPSRISLVRGAGGRRKLLAIQGLEAETLHARIASLPARSGSGG